MISQTDKTSDLLTVIVPTRDRADTLVHCLKTVTAQPNLNLEILVSDNYSGPEVKQVVDQCNDARVRYIRTNTRLGMSEHWEFALNHASGNWVTILGDDDGLLPHAVNDFFSLTKKHPDIKALVAVNCSFRWPATNAANPNSKLCYIGGKGYAIRSTIESLERTLKGEIIHLPSIYTGGFVHIDVVREIKRLSPNGTMFLSISPDIYSAIAICSVTDKYIFSRQPWSVTGSSHHSNGRQHREIPKSQAKQLPMHCETRLHFHPSLGDGCVEAMQIAIYESVLQSAHLRKDNFGITLFDQLVISIMQSGKRTRYSVTDYCREVARVNGIDFDSVLKRAHRRRFRYRLHKVGKKIAKIFPTETRLRRHVIRNACPKTIADAMAILAGETEYVKRH